MLITGAEAADREAFAGLQGRDVAVLCNPTSLVRLADGTRRRVHLVDQLRQAGVRVTRLFGPEHGLWSTAQDMIGVGSGLDPIFGLPVDTLYGHDEQSLIPRPEALRGVDVLVFDVQDVGARYYTYAATLCMALTTCAACGVQVVVLDRPNPLGGEEVEGNQVGADHRSFVGWIDLPQRHGLTVGEIARLYVAEAGLQVGLQVVPCQGWDPSLYIDEQDDGARAEAWTCPSPNMPTVTTAVLYPGLCLLEGTRLSEGRGTTRPFELVGAPGLDARAFCAAVEALSEGELNARPLCYEPVFQKHAGRVCGGAMLEVPDRRRLRSVRAGLAVIAAAMATQGEGFGWRTETYEFVSDRLAIDLLMGGALARETLERGGDLDEATADFAAAQKAFALRARPHLLYPRQHGPLAPEPSV